MGNSSNRSSSQAPTPSAPTEYAATPIDRICYGGRSCTAMSCRTVADDLMDYLAEAPIFSCPEDALLSLGFLRCIDYPHLPDHIYYEGYFHASASDDPIPSLNPRNGRPFRKPPAPSRLRAFYVAFRAKNAARFLALRDAIRQLSCEGLDQESAEELKEFFQQHLLHAQSVAPAGHPCSFELDAAGFPLSWHLSPEQAADAASWVPYVFAELFDPSGAHGDLLVGDLAVQVHFGRAVEERDVGWHFDSINSAFHLALSIRGERTLWTSVSDSADEDARNRPTRVTPLRRGDAYISSPANFRHGVSYPEKEWGGRTVAVQARFLLTRGLLRFMQRATGPDSKGFHAALSEAVARAIVEGFDMPSLGEVQEVAQLLREFDGELVVEKNFTDGQTIPESDAPTY